MKKSLKKILSCLLLFVVMAFTFSGNTFAITNSTSAMVQASSLSKLSNNYPIVMVHGLFGWGNDELFGVNYWGGKESLKDLLTKKGYTVYTPTIGSISSNWDRACELYAYLKGGTVDYGYAHSSKAGHERFGRTYPGVYPEWGTTDAGDIKKIHLIGHSMGGQTIRVLAQLLENGDKDEINCNKDSTSPLFIGNKHWIDSILTIATPHDGSQEDNKQSNLEPFTHDFFAAMASNAGILNSDNPCFDFKMDQWGLKKQSDESYESYYKRIFNSNIWKETKDLSIWDLSQEGSKELNSWVKVQKDIYYFSIACVDTHKGLLTQYQIPNINMNPLLLKSSIFMGQYTNSTYGEVQVDKSWWRNDGIVSVISAIGPHEGSQDKIVRYDANATTERGVWNYMGEINNIDHVEVVKQSEPRYHKYLQNKFIELANMLTKLDK
ncbi:esterase/lipase family protein [Clostridium estertheticum]|uniref:esterase/lipase family protein n=1 Tax=Clostridium estertheticum TaxID=238834 RepID=UPI001C0C2625|nr:lipase [Clostridium estertheticum]MBU3216572.1 lipase [Clostridium estertheticum]